jgi:hypothetical protein
MVDIDGDGYADFCRLTAASNLTDPTKPAQMSCLINDIIRPETVQTGDLAWLTANGLQTGQYCRVRADNHFACTAIY